MILFAPQERRQNLVHRLDVPNVKHLLGRCVESLMTLVAERDQVADGVVAVLRRPASAAVVDVVDAGRVSRTAAPAFAVVASEDGIAVPAKHRPVALTFAIDGAVRALADTRKLLLLVADGLAWLAAKAGAASVREPSLALNAFARRAQGPHAALFSLARVVILLPLKMIGGAAVLARLLDARVRGEQFAAMGAGFRVSGRSEWHVAKLARNRNTRSVKAMTDAQLQGLTN